MFAKVVSLRLCNLYYKAQGCMEMTTKKKRMYGNDCQRNVLFCCNKNKKDSI